MDICVFPEKRIYACFGGKGLTSRSIFYREPQKKVISSYFDSFSPLNMKRSKMKAFLEISLVPLTLRARTVF